uniref:Transcriptional regulator, BadM/Rrf2 family n=1 Tax=Cyanothece sp. (strain PCC 7425 / ATCC 29141) TaxID=395961 RepID=B8HKW5_CYAP4
MAMELPIRVHYGLLALLELSLHATSRQPLKANAIAARQEIASRYLEQILSMLRQAGIVASYRGAAGGYTLARDPSEITVWDVFSCLEGETINKQPAPDGPPNLTKEILQEIWQQSTTAAQNVLQQITLQDLLIRRKEYKQDSPMFYI